MERFRGLGGHESRPERDRLLRELLLPGFNEVQETITRQSTRAFIVSPQENLLRNNRSVAAQELRVAIWRTVANGDIKISRPVLKAKHKRVHEIQLQLSHFRSDTPTSRELESDVADLEEFLSGSTEQTGEYFHVHPEDGDAAFATQGALRVAFDAVATLREVRDIEVLPMEQILSLEEAIERVPRRNNQMQLQFLKRRIDGLMKTIGETDERMRNTSLPESYYRRAVTANEELRQAIAQFKRYL